MIYLGLTQDQIDAARGRFLGALRDGFAVRLSDGRSFVADSQHYVGLFERGVHVATRPTCELDSRGARVEFFAGGYTTDTKTKTRGDSVKTYVRLFKDGDSMGIETNANTEVDFHNLFTARLAGIIEGEQFKGDVEFQLGYWLNQYVEICCKLRGYKADVVERRVISSGWDAAPADAEIIEPST